MISVFDEGPFAPCPDPFNMAAYVLAAGRAVPQKDALLVLGETQVERWTYADIRRAVLGTATGLLQRGLRAGDMVLLRLGNTVDFPIAYLGALAAGMVPVPSSAALTTRETAYIVDLLKPKAVLRDAYVPCPDHPLILDAQELRAWRDLPEAAIHWGDPERLGYVIFTSGTSGKPRAVAHAHRAIWARQMMFDDWYGLTANDRVLHAGAFNWTYTLGTGLMDPWSVAATAMIAAPDTPPDYLPDLLAKHHATIFAAAPGVYRQLLKSHPLPRFPALRHGLSAGETLPETTANQWREATGCEVFEAFGMSECSTFISQQPPLRATSGTMGRPQRGRRVAVLKDGVPVPRGCEGTIAVHRSDPGLMLEYLGAPHETARRMFGEWFLTGDQAIMQPSGDMIYKGRDDDMMNAGGFRVSPVEVEKVLAAVDGITAVAVTEVEIKPDTFVIAAFYAAPAALDETVLRSYVSDNLARYKQPRLFIHLPELPLGANGKILRRGLRAQFKRPK